MLDLVAIVDRSSFEVSMLVSDENEEFEVCFLHLALEVIASDVG